MGRVAVLHPDLGLGGAERLIVDASRALQDGGHQVTIYTGYHDPKRCFKETRDGTLRVVTIGSWIPRSVFGRCHALLAYLKMIYIALHVLLFASPDLALCDQVSACVPILKLKIKRVVFYCHFPDQLLTNRETLVKSIYRQPLDQFEEFSTAAAHVILANSRFTRSVVMNTFRSLRHRDITIVYPCVDVDAYSNLGKPEIGLNSVRECVQIAESNYIFLSLNRFERKKNLALAIKALSECLAGYEQLNKNYPSMKAHLVIAGGYDQRLEDSVKYYDELRDLVRELNLAERVTFIESPNDSEKQALLNSSSAILYTPTNEHFGIVPLEAMVMSKPVIACNSGGPLETVKPGVTGFLCEPDEYSFADAMLQLYSDEELGAMMGMAGFERVKKRFSYEVFRFQINQICYPPD